jgi:hypothetical protein
LFCKSILIKWNQFHKLLSSLSIWYHKFLFGFSVEIHPSIPFIFGSSRWTRAMSMELVCCNNLQQDRFNWQNHCTTTRRWQSVSSVLNVVYTPSHKKNQLVKYISETLHLWIDHSTRLRATDCFSAEADWFRVTIMTTMR